MSKLTTRLLTPDELSGWDAFVGQSQRGHLFHSRDYLKHLGQTQVIGVFSGSVLQAGFPVPVLSEAGEQTVKRSSYVCPYFSPVFDVRGERRVHADRRARVILSALIEYLQSRYTEIMIPLHPDVSDMVPFQHAHFNLELRYTYLLRLSSLEEIWDQLGSDVRNRIRRADGVHVEVDEHLERFDFEQATFYEEREQRDQWEALVRALVRAGRGTAMVATSQGEALGGLFLARYNGIAYNLLSYFDRRSTARGVAPRLLWAAIQLALERGDRLFDFEGSVLPTIESFFQGFGGERAPYYQIHWHRDERQLRPILYHYT